MRRVLVTGASSGIGAEAARLLAREGCSLVLAARRREMLEAVASECLALGAPEATVEAGDVGDLEFAARLGASVGDEGHPAVVNNAGFAVFGSFDEMGWPVVESHVQAMLLGPMATVHAALPGMVRAGGGTVVNVLSIVSRVGLSGVAAYTAAKSGLMGFGQAVLAEYRKRGVRVTNVFPAATATPIWDGVPGAPPLEGMIPLAAVAEAVRWAVMQPQGSVVEEIVVTPPGGVL